MPTPERTSPPPDASDTEPPRPQPTTVVLVRHGLTPTTGKQLPGRTAGLHLSEDGRSQAKEAAEQVARLHAREGGQVSRLFASPLERTVETAEPIAAAVGLDIETDADLLDIDVGDWTGMTLEEAGKRPEWHMVQRYPSAFGFPGGESFLDMQIRLVNRVNHWRAAHPGETVVAVTHADPIRMIAAHALGVHLDLFQRISVSTCSLTVLSLSDSGPRVLTVNARDVSPLIRG